MVSLKEILRTEKYNNQKKLKKLKKKEKKRKSNSNDIFLKEIVAKKKVKIKFVTPRLQE